MFSSQGLGKRSQREGMTCGWSSASGTGKVTPAANEAIKVTDICIRMGVRTQDFVLLWHPELRNS